MQAKRRALVLGGSGFIGRSISEALVMSKEYDVYITSRIDNSGCSSSVKCIKINLLNMVELENLFSKQWDVVINSYGVIDQSTEIGVYRRMQECNLQFVVYIADLFKTSNCRNISRWIQIGSNAEYGDVKCPQTPDGGMKPNSAYGWSKAAGSKLLLALFASEGFPVTIVRPFLVFGAKQSKKSLLSQLIEAARLKLAINVSAGEQTRDFVSVEKVADDIMHVIEDKKLVGLAVNSCTGHPTRLLDCYQIFKRFKPDCLINEGAVAYRKTEMFESYGCPYRPITHNEAKSSLEHFIYQEIFK